MVRHRHLSRLQSIQIQEKLREKHSDNTLALVGERNASSRKLEQALKQSILVQQDCLSTAVASMRRDALSTGQPYSSNHSGAGGSASASPSEGAGAAASTSGGGGAGGGASAPAGDEELLPGWRRAVDTRTMVAYYYHTSGETSWEKPVARPAVPADTDVRGESVEAPLPAGWSEAKDPSGTPYYWHVSGQVRRRLVAAPDCPVPSLLPLVRVDVVGPADCQLRRLVSANCRCCRCQC